MSAQVLARGDVYSFYGRTQIKRQNYSGQRAVDRYVPMIRFNNKHLAEMGLPTTKIAIEDTNPVFFLTKPDPEARFKHVDLVPTTRPQPGYDNSVIHKLSWANNYEVQMYPALGLHVEHVRDDPHTLLEWYRVDRFLRWHIPQNVIPVLTKFGLDTHTGGFLKGLKRNW